jgi:GMP synthase (glutamine-hydrolysing)
MIIGILQTGHAPDALRDETGDYPDMFARRLAAHGLDSITWDVTSMRLPEGPHDAEGWLITGSRHGAYEDHPWIAPLEELIRRIVEARVPLVGICFGHQIVAQALGGTVEKVASGWSVGPTHYRLADGGARVLHAWHQDQVVRLPEGARTTASAEGCPHAALAIGDRVMTWQPHPEYDDRVLAGLMEHRGKAVPPDRLEAARAKLGTPLDTAAVWGDIAAFFRRGADGASSHVA